MNEDKIIAKLAEHDQKFDELLKKTDFNEFRNQILPSQDKIMEILQRLDQERIFTTAWVSRIEKEVEEHAKEIARVKAALKIQ